MVSLEWTVAERGGVSLVECRVENDAAVDRRVRVASRLDGPVWPPRRAGVPEAGWDDGGYEGTVGAGQTVALGFASPASPADPPVEVAWTERSAAGSGAPVVHPGGRVGAGEDDVDGNGIAVAGSSIDAGENSIDAGESSTDAGESSTDAGENSIDAGESSTDVAGSSPGEPTPADVLRELGDPRPPADAVPLPGPGGDAGRSGTETGRPPTDTGRPSTENTAGAAESTPADVRASTDDRAPPGSRSSTDGGAPTDDRAPADDRVRPDPSVAPGKPPAAVAAWLDGVAARVERGEALVDADGLTDAARGLEAAGGLDAAAALRRAVADDARRLRRVADRAGALADRAEATAEAPVGTLRRLA